MATPKLNLMYLNVTDCVTLKEPKFTKIRQEVENLLSYEIMNGRLDVTKPHQFFVSTIYGAANVNLIPKGH
jgi:hypothetical protein